jgi:PEP-CTERM motif
MARYATVAGLVALLVLSLAAGARAGFVDGSFGCTFPDESNPTSPPGYSWSFDYGQPALTLGTLSTDMNADRLAMCIQAANTDPTFLVSETVTNSSGVAWTGYRLVLSGDPAVTFVPPASSDTFGSAVVTPYEIDYTAPSSVPSGTSVNLAFQINVANPGLFSWTMTQQPLPEPATVALMGIGGVGLLMMRRRSRV